MLGKIKSLLFQNSSIGQTVAKNTFWLVAGELIGRLIRFSIVIYATRLLGPGEYGVFAYVMAIAAFVTIFSDIGLSAILTREAVKNPERQQEYVSTAFVLKLLLIAVNIPLVLFVVPIISRVEGALPLLPLVVFVFIFDSLREFGFGLNRALEKMEREAATKVILNVAIAVLGYFFLVQNNTAYSLTLGYVIGTAVGFLTITWFLRGHFKKIFLHINRKLFYPIFAMAWPIGLMGVLGAIMLNTDMVMLGWWEGNEQLGYYALSQKLITLLYILPTLLASAAFPVFTRLAHNNPDYFPAVLKKLLFAVFALGLPVCVGGIIVADQLVAFFGPEFLPATRTVQILLLSLLIVYPSTILSNALVAFNKQKKFLLFVSIGAIGNALFNTLLIPVWGIEGAATSTVLTQFIANVFVWIQIKRTISFTILPLLPRLFLATGVMTASTWYLHAAKVSLVSNIPASVLVYFATLYLIGGFKSANLTT